MLPCAMPSMQRAVSSRTMSAAATAGPSPTAPQGSRQGSGAGSRVTSLCVIAADSAHARFFLAEDSGAPRAPLKLVERDILENPDLRTLGRSVTGRPRTETNTNREAGPVHPMGAQRERHRIELERRYALRIAGLAGKITHAWKTGTVLLVAEARLLGLVREPLRKVLQPKIELKELARNHAHLTPPELRDELAASGILPG